MESQPISEEVAVEDAEVVSIEGEVRAIEPAQSLLPVPQVAAVAATGFAVGAVTAAVMVKRSTKKPRRRLARKRRKRGELLDIASSRSFLVDIHLLNRS